MLSFLQMPAGQTATREELLELTRILESAAESAAGVATDPPLERSAAASRDPAAVSLDAPTRQETAESVDFTTDNFRFSSPGSWIFQGGANSSDASEITIALDDENARIGVKVDTYLATASDRLASSPRRLADAHRLRDCRKEWDYREWGHWQGWGQSLLCQRDGSPVKMKLFVAKLGERRHLEVHEIFVPAAETRVLEAEYLIQRSLRVVEPGGSGGA